MTARRPPTPPRARPEGPGPHRTCVGCGTTRAQADLVRLVLDEVGQAVRDRPDGPRLPGRGAYVCDRACAAQALRRRGLHRGFRRAVQPAPGLIAWAAEPERP